MWFTVAAGVLSDVYFPTNDTTNNETLQYVVTDGATFTDGPQDFQFGVCASASADPCTFPAGEVPKAMDVLLPAGTTQADELDYTAHDPVTIAPVVVP